MRSRFLLVLTLLLCSFLNTSFAQEKITGSLLKEFGETYTVPQPDIPVDTTATYRVVFDIAKSPENPAKLNPYFNTVARFLNMNTSAGVTQDHLKPVLVVHGSAAFGLLTNQYYKEKFGVDNPNLKLLERFHALNIPIVLCGQTAGSRGITSEKRWQHTQMALSAMNALVYYQNLNYALISF